MKKLRFFVAVILAICISFCLCCCKEEPPVPHGIVKGSVDITTENLPTVFVDKNYDYIGLSLVSNLLRVDKDTNVGTATEPKTVKDLVNVAENSENCFDALKNGSCDIAIGLMADDKQLNDLLTTSTDIKAITLGSEKLIFFTGPDCNVTTLSVDQIKDIFSGKVKKWSELGGNKLDVSVFEPEETSFEYDWFTSYFGKLASKPQKPVDIYSTAEGIFTAIADYDNRSGAISYTTSSHFSITGVGGTKTVLSVTDSAGNIIKFEKPIVISVRTSADSDNINSIVYNWLLSSQGESFIKNVAAEIEK